jgi:hypothetical protein
MRNTNIATYTITNTAAYNARMGMSTTDSEAANFRSALLAQAIDAGVSDTML